MKKISLILAFILATTLIVSLCACAPSKADKLVIYNWADYIYDTDLEDFAEFYLEQTGREIEITYVTFDTNETMLTKIQQGDADVDVICPSEYAIQKLIEGGYCLPINYFDDDQYQNSQYVDDRIIEKIDNVFSSITCPNVGMVKMSDYMVPYMWGTLGVLYNQDVFESNGVSIEEIYDAGWGVLWNKDKNGDLLCQELNKRIFMKDSIRDVYASTVLYLKQYDLLPQGYETLPVGQLINTVDDILLSAVEQALLNQKEVLYGYEVDFGKNDLIAGTAYADLAWSGDAIYAIEEGESEGVTLNYFSPEVGGNIWFDGWIIPTSCQNETGAKLFIDYLNRPDVATQNMVYIGYTSAVDSRQICQMPEVLEILLENEYAELDEDGNVDASYFFDSEIRYPLDHLDSDYVDTRLGVMKDFGTSNSKVVQIWERVRSTGVSAWTLLGVSIVIFGIVVGTIFLLIYVDQRKRMCVLIENKD